MHIIVTFAFCWLRKMPISPLSHEQLWEWNELKKQGIRGVFDCSCQKQTWPLTQLIKSTHTTCRLRLRMNVTLTFFREHTGICRCLEPLKIVWKDLLSPWDTGDSEEDVWDAVDGSSAAAVDIRLRRIRRLCVFEYELRYGFFLQWSNFEIFVSFSPLTS